MSKKILSIFLGIIILFSFPFVSSLSVANADFLCSVSPSSISNTKNPVTFTVDSHGNLAGGKYYVSAGSAKIGANRASIGTLFDASGGKITVTVSRTYDVGTWQVGVYPQYDSGHNLCQNASFSVYGSSSGGNTCALSFTKPDPFNPKPSDYIAAKITNLSGNFASDGPDALYHTYIRENNNDGATVWDGCIKKSNFTDPNGFGFGYLSTGKYYIQVNDKCGGGFLFINAENQACYSSFFVDPSGGGIGQSGSPDNPAPNTPCLNHDKNGACLSVATGLGVDIGTNPASITSSLFGIILGISGAIALILIMISGYRILVSQGNPEALKGAREQLTAAIVGLLFILLSIVVLQIIGINILHLPGFSGGGGGSGTFFPNGKNGIGVQ